MSYVHVTLSEVNMGADVPNIWYICLGSNWYHQSRYVHIFTWIYVYIYTYICIYIYIHTHTDTHTRISAYLRWLLESWGALRTTSVSNMFPCLLSVREHLDPSLPVVKLLISSRSILQGYQCMHTCHVHLTHRPLCHCIYMFVISVSCMRMHSDLFTYICTHGLDGHTCTGAQTREYHVHTCVLRFCPSVAVLSVPWWYICPRHISAAVTVISVRHISAAVTMMHIPYHMIHMDKRIL
jgi:hypothetical protein